jgi:hypothetical protein
MVEPGDDHSTDVWQQFRLLRDAHAYFLELTGLEQHAKKLAVNFLRGGEFGFDGRRRYRLYEIKAFPGGTAPSPYDGEFWCSYPEHDMHCEIDCKLSSARWTGPVTAEWQAFDGRQKSEYNVTLIWVCWGAVLDFLQGVGFLSKQPQSDSTGVEQSSPSEQSQSDLTGAEQSPPPEQPMSHEEPQAKEASRESLEPKWDPLADWSVETVFRELEVSGPAMRTIVTALPELPALPNRLRRFRGKSVVEILDNISAAELFEAIGKLGSPDSCEKFKRAWKKYRAKQGIFIR